MVYHFNFVDIVNFVVVEITKVDKIIQAMKKKVNIRKVENNTFIAIFLK